MTRHEYAIVPPGGQPDPADTFTSLPDAIEACWDEGGEQVWERQVTDWQQVHP